MGEMKGNLFAMIIFIAMILPALLQFTIDTIHQQAFVKHTVEMSEAVRQEANVSSPRVQELKSRYEDKGYSIAFKNTSGGTVSGPIAYGDTVVIEYVYKYNSTSTQRTLNTTNTVYNMQRH